eukprot:223054_1
MSLSKRQRFHLFKRRTHQKLLRLHHYQSSMDVKGLFNIITKKNKEEFGIFMNQLYDSLLILHIHTHTLPINKYGFTSIPNMEEFKKFKFCGDLPSRVRLMISDACFGNVLMDQQHVDTDTMVKMTNVLLSQMQLIDDRKQREIDMIACFWYKKCNGHVLWDRNIVNVIWIYCDLLKVNAKTLHVLMNKFFMIRKETN